MISVVYDACVLYPAPLRDLLLSLAKAKAVFPFWSEEIRDEWIGSLLRKRPNLEERQKRTRREMDIHFPDSLVRGYESITPTLQLPDPKDCHVLAAAIHAKAEYIVTFNLKDFPQTILAVYNIEAVLPDDFVLRLIQENPNRVMEAVKNHRLRLVHPPKTPDEYLATLEKQGLTKTVAFLRERLNDI
jgi:predicted nucleic acid-binding protein